MRKILARVLGTLLVAAAATAASAEAPLGVAEILSGTIFGEDEITRVLEGEKVTTPVREVSPREIGVGLACLVPSGRRASLAMLRNDTPIIPEKYRDGYGPLDLERLEESLAALDLGKGAKGEAQRFLSSEPSYEINLSEAEIDAFTALRPGKGVERGVALVRERVLPLSEDRVLAGDIEALTELIRTGAFTNL